MTPVLRTPAPDPQPSPPERAEMSRRAGRDVRSSGQKCPVERAQMPGRAGRNAPSNGRRCPLGCLTSTSGKLCEGRFVVSRCYDRSTAVHTRPLGTTSLPARRYICARSTGHTCPLGGTYAPARHDIPARSARHSCPLGGTFAATGRDGGAPRPAVRGVLRIRRRRRRHDNVRLPEQARLVATSSCHTATTAGSSSASTVSW